MTQKRKILFDKDGFAYQLSEQFIIHPSKLNLISSIVENGFDFEGHITEKKENFTQQTRNAIKEDVIPTINKCKRPLVCKSIKIADKNINECFINCIKWDYIDPNKERKEEEELWFDEETDTLEFKEEGKIYVEGDYIRFEINDENMKQLKKLARQNKIKRTIERQYVDGYGNPISDDDDDDISTEPDLFDDEE